MAKSAWARSRCRLMGVIADLIDEARPQVQVVFILRFSVGVVDSGALAPAPLRVGIAAFSWTCAVVAIYLLNGVSDIDGDRANHSSRPLAAGRLSPELAVSATVTLMSVAVLSATLVGAASVVLTVLILALGVTYSLGRNAAKRSGNAALAVAAVGALLTYAAGAEAAAPNREGMPTPLLVFAVAITVLLFVLGHVKDLSDVVGDRRAHRRTMPVMLGLETARDLLSSRAVVLAFLFAAAHIVTGRDVPLAVLSLGTAGIALALRHETVTGSTMSDSRTPYRVLMMTQYAANASALVGA